MDQTEQDTILNPGGFSSVDIKELTKDIPLALKFKTVSLKVAATQLGMSVKKLRDFCRDLPEGVEWFGNGYQLDRWTVEAMVLLIEHYKTRQISIFDFSEVKADGEEKKEAPGARTPGAQ